MEADDQSLSAINSLKPEICKSIYNKDTSRAHNAHCLTVTRCQGWDTCGGERPWQAGGKMSATPGQASSWPSGHRSAGHFNWRFHI